MRKIKPQLISLLSFILILAIGLRLYGINWDNGVHLHPDERMLIMVADRINFFENLNPHFFNYGSLPIYLLKGLTQLIDFFFITSIATYDGMLIVGRLLSVTADVLTIFFIFKISQTLFKREVSLLAAFIYAIAFFPIQNSHFFVVDVFLNLFITILVYQLLIYCKKPTLIRVILIGVNMAAALSTKATSLIFIPFVLTVLLVTFFQKKIKFKQFIFHFFIFNFLFLIFYFIFMPYAFLELPIFIRDVKLQMEMNNNAYIFPYTLQYVGTLPYLYYLKNIFLWGLGPIISIISFVGLASLLYQKRRPNFLFFIFYFLYFLIIGRSSVKFMRYMLPLYPFFAILAGYGLYKLYKLYKPLGYISVILVLFWLFMFVNIYSYKHTRIAATDWILKNISPGASIATEHWDDTLPLREGENYKHIELTLYDQPDDEKKWLVLNEKLKQADYIIIASNRLYVPLQKLKNCGQYKICYPNAAEYYKKLFNEQLGFKKVAEFTNYPGLETVPPLAGWKLEINDDSADESFTVYDHPKIMIFKKNGKEN